MTQLPPSTLTQDHSTPERGLALADRLHEGEEFAVTFGGQGADWFATLRELFGDGISNLQLERKVARQAFRSADHYLDFFRTYFRPVKMAFERVGADGEAALEGDLRDLLEKENTAGDRAMVLEADYLQVIATRA